MATDYYALAIYALAILIAIALIWAACKAGR